MPKQLLINKDAVTTTESNALRKKGTQASAMPVCFARPLAAQGLTDNLSSKHRSLRSGIKRYLLLSEWQADIDGSSKISNCAAAFSLCALNLRPP